MQISVTRGLAELKLLNDRINTAIHNFSSIVVVTGKKVVAGYKTNEEYNEKTKSSFQSVQDLIKRRNVIKSAIVNSNASTNVEIGGVTMTVAEAVERKTSIVYEQQLLNKLKNDYAKAVQVYDREEVNAKQRLDEHLKAIYGRDVKIEEGIQKSTTEQFNEQNAPKMVDPLDVKKKIEELEKSINDFLLNVDYELSTSNTLTMIEIPE